jgi:hypothetical protein
MHGGFIMETEQIETAVEKAFAYMKGILGMPSGEKTPLGKASRGVQMTAPEVGCTSEDAVGISSEEYTFKSVAEVFAETARRTHGE